MDDDTADEQRIARRARLVSAMESGLPSPCVSVCRMNEASGLCEGCLRTIDEIMAWGSMADAEKRTVWRQLAQRAEAALAMRRSAQKKDASR